MMAKEFYSDQEAGNDHEESTLLQDPCEGEEEEEALSLCDLPIYSGSISSQWGDFSKEDGRNSRSNSNNDDDDELFEFFSEEFTTSSSPTLANAENIIFCGKLIPFKGPPQYDPKNLESNTTSKRSNIQKKGAFVPNSFGKENPTFSRAMKNKGQGEEGLNLKSSFSCDYASMGKVSLVRSATESRWFLFMFGMSRLSTNEMQLRDIRNRQSRRAPATMFPAPEHGENEVVNKTKGRRNCKGMWKFLRSISLVLGCRSSKIANDVVKAAFV